MNLLQLLNKTNKIKNKLLEKGREAVEQFSQDKPSSDLIEQRIKHLEFKVEQRLLNIEKRLDQLVDLRAVDSKTVHSTNYIQLPKSKKPGYLQ